jgi:hypothetical protein
MDDNKELPDNYREAFLFFVSHELELPGYSDKLSTRIREKKTATD